MLQRIVDVQKSLASRWRLEKAKRAIGKADGALMLHVGCGDNYFDGWKHLDMNVQLKHVDAIWHAEDGLPCRDESCRFIYSEHFLEHVDVHTGLAFLRECHRVLETGGVVRIAMPDLAESVRQYWEGDWDKQPWLEKYGYSWIKTRAEFLNIVFREWGHKWLYDHEELQRRLHEVGFASVVNCELGRSCHEELCGRETRAESLLICEATK